MSHSVLENITDNANIAIEYHDLLLAIVALTHLLQQERAALDANDVRVIEKMQPRKKNLASFIDHQQQNILQQPNILDVLTEQERQELKKQLLILHNAVEESDAYTKKMQSYLQFLIKVSVESAKTQRKSLQIYNKNGNDEQRSWEVSAISTIEKI